MPRVSRASLEIFPICVWLSPQLGDLAVLAQVLLDSPRELAVAVHVHVFVPLFGLDQRDVLEPLPAAEVLLAVILEVAAGFERRDMVRHRDVVHGLGLEAVANRSRHHHATAEERANSRDARVLDNA